MNIKLRKRLRDIRHKGFAHGEIYATRRYRKNLSQIFEEHERQILELVKSHKTEIKTLEKEYSLKQVRVEKKLKKLNDLICDWEEKIQQVKEISSQSREVLARIKQAMYQERKTLANVLDDEKTIEMLQINMEALVQKQRPIPQNSVL
jgi:transcriptional regulator with XRE-family HTH domain